MESNLQDDLIAAKTSQSYVQIQAQAPQNLEGIEREDVPVESPSIIPVLFGLLPPLIILGVLYFFLSKQNNRVRESLEAADRNTAAIEANNELLRENIQLQKELIEEMRKRS
ncbi:MAG: hypothetical protein AAF703_02890 [Cyanobacteria bacterium P01_D01_bin.105]